MPKEILVRYEYHGQVWIEPEPVEKVLDVQNPRHLEKGLRQSPYQKDSFKNRETG